MGKVLAPESTVFEVSITLTELLHMVKLGKNKLFLFEQGMKVLRKALMEPLSSYQLYNHGMDLLSAHPLAVDRVGWGGFAIFMVNQ